MSAELNELKLQLEKLQFDSKEGLITLDAVREQNTELGTEAEDLRRQLSELKLASRGNSQEGKDKRKAEKLAVLLGSFDSGGFSEKEEQIRATLKRLDEAVENPTALSANDVATLRQQLTDTQTINNDSLERIKQYTNEMELNTRRRDELEARLSQVEQDYEELLEKTLNNDENSDSIIESHQDLKVCSLFLSSSSAIYTVLRYGWKHNTRLREMQCRRKCSS